MKRHCSLLLLIIFSGLVAAQKRTQPFCGVDFSHSVIKGQNVKGSNDATEAFVNFSIYTNEQNRIGGRLNYDYSNYTDLGTTFDHSLTGIDADVVWLRKIDERHSLQFVGKFGVYSDFKSFSGNDFRYRIGVNYSIRHTDNLITGFGVAYARQFTGNQINPFISIDYKINDRWKLSGLLPIKPKLTYTINDHLSWVNEISGNVESYRVHVGNSQSSILESSGWYGLSSIELLLKKHHLLSLGMGYSVKQRLRYYESMDASSWKIFTFNLKDNVQPTAEIKASRLKFSAAYSFVF